MGVFKKLGEGIADLTSLEVVTLTGTVQVKINDARNENGEKSGSIIDWTTLIEQANDTSGNVSLVAATKVEFDGDTQQFAADGASQTLLDTHQQAVENAKDVREGLVSMFRSLLGLG